VRRVDPDPDFDVQLTLELARVAREPSHADKERVLEALQVRLGDMPSLSSAGEITTGVRVVVPRLKNAPVDARTARFVRSLVTSNAAAHVVWVGIAMGGLGFWLGARVNDPSEVPSAAPRGAMAASPGVMAAPRAEATDSSPIPIASTEHRAPLAPASVRAVEPTPIPPAGAPAAGAPASAIAAPSSRVMPPEATRRQQRSMPARRSEGVKASAPALDPNARFLEAVRLLSRAQRALDGGEPRLALVLLEEIDERVPLELLREEREAARVIALCQSGDVERARRVGFELAERSPSSIYAARIARSCGAFGKANGEPDPVDRQIAPESSSPRNERPSPHRDATPR
jgi:hypothetical protein